MADSSIRATEIDGPFYDDLKISDCFEGAPTIRLTDGMAAAHHAIVGGRLRLAFDAELSASVTGQPTPFAAPAFVWDVAIGQSTLVTREAIANLFYRGLVFRRAPAIGDSLRTVTTIVGLRPASAKPGRPPRGLVTMRIAASDQQGRPVLDFHRCAMLPARRPDSVGVQGEPDPPQRDMEATEIAAAIRHWDLTTYRAQVPGPHFHDLRQGMAFQLAGGDLVSSAPELARLTMNLATIHHDGTRDGQRLVYGGHTIGLAAAQVTRAFPALVTILGWDGCDHLGPVREGDTVHCAIAVERLEALSGGGGLAHLRCRARATGLDGTRSDVLDWRLIGVFA